jgi:hypothetical protein
MAMIVLSSPATLTGAEEKKTGPSRFNEDFLTEFTSAHTLGLHAWRRGRKNKSSHNPQFDFATQ